MAMTPLPPNDTLPPNFNGNVLLYATPNLVMFPHVMQTLHASEPWHVRLIEEALRLDGLITLARLKPGWKSQYEANPAIESMACVTRIASFARLADGRFNLLLQGLQRFEISRETSVDATVRTAIGRPASDDYPVDNAEQRVTLQRVLRDALRCIGPTAVHLHDELEQSWTQPPQLGILTDSLAHALRFSSDVKQQLLDELNVDRRATFLLDLLSGPNSLDQQITSALPVTFSDN